MPEPELPPQTASAVDGHMLEGSHPMTADCGVVKTDLFGKPVVNAIYTAEASAQRRIRMTLSAAAYAYEKEGVSIMSDEEFDTLAKEVRPDIDTGHPVMDNFFRTEFSTDTGMWIHAHPELYLVEQYYRVAMGLISKATYLKRTCVWKAHNR